MKPDRILLLVALLFVVLGGIWFFAFRPAASPPAAENAGDAADPVLSATAVVPAAPAEPPATAGAVAAADDGSEKVSAIISDPDLGDNVMVEKLFELLPKLDEASQADAAEHIANLSSDEEAAKWSRSVIAWNLPPAAAEVLYQSLNNRSHEINYPVLGAIADRPDHPKNQETLETLSVISDPPPAGTTWTQWLQTKLREEAGQTNP